MKYIDEYRDGKLAARLVKQIRRIQIRPWVIMEVCGGQTHSIGATMVSAEGACAAYCAYGRHLEIPVQAPAVIR